jgi:thioredoxin reductase (NADPH)
VVILGAGPAGLTAGIYAVRSGLKTVILEKAVPGGQIVNTGKIENYPGFPDGVSGAELMKRFEEQAAKLGVEIKSLTEAKGLEVKDSVKVIQTSQGEIKGKSVIIATGASPTKLGVPGEAELTGRGVSYCATCDGAFFKGKKVLVVGGGNSAIEEAIFLTRFASQVLVVHRRDQLRAVKILQERAMANPKIKFIWNSHLDEVKGKEKVEAAVIRDKLTQEKKIVPVEGVFIYVGVNPNTNFLPPSIKLNDKGFVVTDENLSTGLPGIFAAGDVRANQLKQVVVAVGEGALAAHLAEKYITG